MFILTDFKLSCVNGIMIVDFIVPLIYRISFVIHIYPVQSWVCDMNQSEYHRIHLINNSNKKKPVKLTMEKNRINSCPRFFTIRTKKNLNITCCLL